MVTQMCCRYPYPFATLETKRELEPRCVLQLFLGLLLAHFFPSRQQQCHVKVVFSQHIACENVRFSSLFVDGDVWRGGTSATQRQKFHTESVRNPVRSADWSTEQLYCFSYCLRMTDKRQKATKVKCKREESLIKQSIFLEYTLLQKKRLSFAGACWQMNTTLYQNRPEDTQNWTNLYLKPHDYWICYVNIGLRHQYGVADVPPRVTSPAAKSEEKRVFSQATQHRS